MYSHRESHHEEREGQVWNLEKIDKLITEADESFIRSFLADLLKNDVLLENRFRMKLFGDDTELDFNAYKNMVDSVIFEYSRYDDFINYYDAMELTSELGELLSKEGDVLFNKKKYKEAF